MKDNRDPRALGAYLLGYRTPYPQRPLSACQDSMDRTSIIHPDHTADPSPLEKYGDPRTIPSTMLCAIG